MAKSVRIIITILAFMIVLSALPVWVQATPYAFSGGNGTSSNPYQIGTLEDLNRVRDYSNSHFILINDINASDTKNWNSGKGFIPLGSDSNNLDTFDYNYFNGTFNGAGYEITGLYINIPNMDLIGLFSCINFNAQVYNLNLTYAEVTGSWFVGALVGTNFGNVSNCNVKGSVDGIDTVGGMVGWNEGELTNCKANVSTEGRDEVGGLVGFNSGLISDCFVYGDVQGENMVGGLVGFNIGGATVQYSAPFSEVSGYSYVNHYVGKNIGFLNVLIWGYVNYSDASPATNAQLVLDGREINVFTDETGFFYFWVSGTVVQSGSMELTAKLPSYTFDTVTITNVNENFSPKQVVLLTGEPSDSDDSLFIVGAPILIMGGIFLFVVVILRYLRT